MGRTSRRNRPGAVFHLTARTQGGERWFTPTLRTRIVELVADAFRGSDYRLLAYAVMPNHLHLVVRQGRRKLGEMMQPLLRRIALLVQRSHGVEGHVFERRFHDTLCDGRRQERNVIMYVNLNPLGEELATDPAAYPWTSHRQYVKGRSPIRCMNDILAVEEGLEIFRPPPHERGRATTPAAGPASDPASYEEHVARVSRRRGQIAEEAERATRGDERRAALDRVARRTLAAHGSRVSLDRIRSGDKARAVVRLRREIVVRTDAEGFSRRDIADHLALSQSGVSRILRRGRPAPALRGRQSTI